MLLRQFAQCAQQIAMTERRVLAAIHFRQFLLAGIDQMKLRPSAAPQTLLAEEAMIKDRIEPAPQIALIPTSLPAGESPLESVLHEIIGALTIAARQSPGEAPQTGELGFDQSSLFVRHCPPRPTTITPILYERIRYLY